MTENEEENINASNPNSGFIIFFNAANPDEYRIGFTVGIVGQGGRILFGDKNMYAEWLQAIEDSGGKMNWD